MYIRYTEQRRKEMEWETPSTFAASAYCPFWKSKLNFLTNKSSAPARLLRTAILSARSGFCKTVLMYGIILSSSTLTDNTCKNTNIFRMFTPNMVHYIFHATYCIGENLIKHAFI